MYGISAYSETPFSSADISYSIVVSVTAPGTTTGSPTITTSGANFLQ